MERRPEQNFCFFFNLKKKLFRILRCEIYTLFANNIRKDKCANKKKLAASKTK